MARARNIKPSLFKNELLGMADPFLTLLFQSLWTLADKEGRLEDRPLRIKAETFPYREGLDVNGYLTELQRLGFILRYRVGEQALIQVVNFKKHQTPHSTEKASEFPSVEAGTLDRRGSSACSVKLPVDNGEITEALPPDSLNLIPDSLNLIPDSKAAHREFTQGGEEHENPAPLKPENINLPPITAAGAMAIELSKRGVAITSMNPDLLDWIEKGVTIPQACEAVALARQKKPEPERISAGYLNSIMHGEIINPKQKKASGPGWWTSEELTNQKAAELGTSARPTESWPEFRARLHSMIAQRKEIAA